MSVQWAIRLALADAASLAPLRLIRGIEVAEKDSFVWARGANSDEKIERLLRALPAIARYEITAGNRLREVESRIPSESLPALNWQPASTWLRVRMPTGPLTPSFVKSTTEGRPALSPSDGERESLRRVSLRIIRSAVEQPIDLLVTTLEEWREFALNAPELRLRQLRFAVDETGNVIVRGKPLPPVRGRQFVLDGNIAVQAGFTWEPAVSADVLSRRLGLSADALALFHDDGTFSRIESEQFVPATRSAIRETAGFFAQ
jgi:hypothetical protein